MDKQIRITEQELGENVVYHWQILREDGSEFSHSAYHTDRAECEAEAVSRLEYARSQEWL